MTFSSVARPPIRPGDDEARRWLSEELAKAPYQESKPGPLELFWRAVLEWLQDALDGVRSLDADTGVLLLGLAAVVVIVLAVWIVRPRLNAAVRQPDPIFGGGEVLEAAGHRALAAEAARDRRYDDALTEVLRAVIRSAEERVLIDPAPGRTAAEVSCLLEARFPARVDDVRWLAVTFNDVRYGGVPASAEDYERARSVDAQLESGRPQGGGSAPAGLAVPS